MDSWVLATMHSAGVDIGVQVLDLYVFNLQEYLAFDLIRRSWLVIWEVLGFMILFTFQLLLKMKSLSRVQLFAIPWTVDHQAPPSMGSSRQDYWSGLPFS